MSKLRATLAKLLTKRMPTDGFHPTSIPDLDLVKMSKTSQPKRTLWSSSFVIVIQGQKELILETFTYKYKEAHTIVTPVGLPVTSRIVVENSQKPFLAIRIKIDPIELYNVAVKMPIQKQHQSLITHGILTGPADENMLAVAHRLIELSADDAPVLGPLLIQELYYYFLRSENGAAIRQFVLSGSKFQAITEAIRKLRSDLKTELDVEEFAKSARMSRTTFFNTFKEVTAMSPIQYQKKFRLMEAKHLLTTAGETAENAAFAVGYKSASQFSREFSRMFGHSPKH